MELISSSANYSDSPPAHPLLQPEICCRRPAHSTHLSRTQAFSFLGHLRPKFMVLFLSTHPQNTLCDISITVDHLGGKCSCSVESRWWFSSPTHPLFRSAGSFADGGVLGRSSREIFARWMRASSARTAASPRPPLTRATPPPTSRWRCLAVESSQCRWTAPPASVPPRTPPRRPLGQTCSASALGSRSPTSTWTSCSRLSSPSSWTPPRLRTGTLPKKRCWVKWLFLVG